MGFFIAAILVACILITELYEDKANRCPQPVCRREKKQNKKHL